MPKVAVVTDTRGGSLFDEMADTLTRLEQNRRLINFFFLKPAMRRSSSGIRRPAASIRSMGQFDDSLQASIQRERELLAPLRLRADYIIDTTNTSPAQLRERLAGLFLGNSVLGMKVTCMSFGFKYGAATEADIVFDVRCLPNPFYVDDLRSLTGLDKRVADFVMDKEETKGFVERMFSPHRLSDLLFMPMREKARWSSRWAAQGARHRSVALAELLCSHLLGQEINAGVLHRDIDKGRLA